MLGILDLNVVKVINEPHCVKTCLWGSNQARHKPGCIATEDGQRLEIRDLERRGIVLLWIRKFSRDFYFAIFFIFELFASS